MLRKRKTDNRIQMDRLKAQLVEIEEGAHDVVVAAVG
jgi:hypothetical protein